MRRAGLVTPRAKAVLAHRGASPNGESGENRQRVLVATHLGTERIKRITLDRPLRIRLLLSIMCMPTNPGVANCCAARR
jgi:hypothetical protein